MRPSKREDYVLLARHLRGFPISPDIYYPEWKSWQDFLRGDREQEVIEQARGIFQRAKSRGRLPSRRSKDLQQKQDSNWIHNKKAAKTRPGRSAKRQWYPVINTIAEEYGFPGVFDISDREQKVITQAREIFQRAKKRGLPHNRSKDPQDIKDLGWINNKKSAMAGKGNARSYPVLKKIAKEHGFPDVFNDREQEAIRRATEIFQRAKKRGRLPRRTKDKQESMDAGWIVNKRQAQSRSDGRSWYPSLNAIAEKYGFPEAFDIVDREQEMAVRAEEIFQRAKRRGRLPRSKKVHKKHGTIIGFC